MDVDANLGTTEDIEKLAELLAALQQSPFSYPLHYQHLALAEENGSQESLSSAVEMLTSCLAVADDVWIPFLRSKTKAVADLVELVQAEVSSGALEDIDDPLVTASQTTEELFQRAEQDYLSIPILCEHLQFIFDQHERAAKLAALSQDMPQFAAMYSGENSSTNARSVVQKAQHHLSQSYRVWDLWMEWEENRLHDLQGSTKHERALTLAAEYRERMFVAHLNHGNTFINYSTFVTKYLPDEDYEQVMTAVVLDKKRQTAIGLADERDRYESSLTSLSSWSTYLTWESAPKPGHYQKKVRGRQAKPVDIPPDLTFVTVLYERAIAEAAKARAEALRGDQSKLGEAEAWLNVFWTGLADTLKAQKEATRDVEAELNILRSGIRSVPSSAEVAASLIRSEDYHVSLDQDDDEGWKRVENVFNQAIGTGLLDAPGITTVTIATAGYCKRRLTPENADLDEERSTELFQRLRTVLHSGIEATRSKDGGDPALKLEKYLSLAYAKHGFEDQAVEIWAEAAKFYKKSYYVWSSYTDFLVNVINSPEQARKVFENAANPSRSIDYPQAVWNSWISFEEYYGTAAQLDYARARVKKLENSHSQKAANSATETSVVNPPAVEATVTSITAGISDVQAMAPTAQSHQGMEVDGAVEQLISSAVTSIGASGRQKRKAEDEVMSNDDVLMDGPQSKRTKPATDPPLKRDRENSTVLVTGLALSSDDAAVKRLFRDCGPIREVFIKSIQRDAQEELAATVEFMDSEGVPPALTKDKKRIDGSEVAVHLAWRSTLYATNFPEKTDDSSIRELFSPYGTIWDVRWPSKKFKETRRFCYIQFITPASATAALELNGKTFEPEEGKTLTMSVAVSNPQRKKERTDANTFKKEVHVGNLPRTATKKEIEDLFKQCGSVRAVRLMTDAKGNPTGTAFIEFENDTSASAAVLNLHNTEMKKRNITVTLANAKSRRADLNKDESKTIWLQNVPQGTQEGLLQQAVEKVASGVKSVHVLHNEAVASVLFDTAADAGRLLLQQSTLEFQNESLPLSETKPLAKNQKQISGGAPSGSSSTLGLIPRAAHRPKAPKPGLGAKKKLIKVFDTKITTTTHNSLASSSATMNDQSTQPVDSGKNQDAFRAMLAGSK